MQVQATLSDMVNIGSASRLRSAHERRRGLGAVLAGPVIEQQRAISGDGDIVNRQGNDIAHRPISSDIVLIPLCLP